jgi:hypothetical protein
MELSQNKQRMARGELYHAFTPELVAERARCKHACARYNNAGEVPRRKLTELFREYVFSAAPRVTISLSRLTSCQHHSGQDSSSTTSTHTRRGRSAIRK